MIVSNNELPMEQRKLLKSLIGAKLISIDAAIVAPPDMAWNTVRIHTNKGNIDVNCLLESVPINDEGDTDGFGIVSVVEANCEDLVVASASVDITVFSVEQIVVGVTIVNGCVESSENGIPFCCRKYTKAIVIETEQEKIVLDRQVWFHEMMSVQFGQNVLSMIRDESDDWEDDPDDPAIHFSLSSEQVVL